MDKAELQKALQSQGLLTMRKAISLKQCLSDSLEELKDKHKADGIYTSELQLSDNGLPSFITKASDSIRMMTSDNDKSIYTVDISSDGVAMKGKLMLLYNYPQEVTHMTVSASMEIKCMPL